MKMESLYVLQLENGKYYVGKSLNVASRFKQHLDGYGSMWTTKYRPIRIIEQRPINDQFDETNTTKLYMKKYGIENVRGGAYSQIELPDGVEDIIRHELRDSDNKCFKCGKPGHFARYCKGRSSFTASCECGSKFLDFEEYMSHMKGCKVRLPYTKRSDGLISMPLKTYTKEPKRETGKCYRCGRVGHYSPDCYARKHVNGEYLSDDN